MQTIHDISDWRTLIPHWEEQDVLLLADEHTRALVDWDIPCLVLPAGEEYKSLESVNRIWDFLHNQHATRHTLLLCLGGGCICDMGGFAAATFKRGMPYITIPTSLLAMVDAAQGGKTGFDCHGVKNEIGCFYPPVDVVLYPLFLQSLPAEEVLSGYAEMIKCALIADEAELWKLLAWDMDAYLLQPTDLFTLSLTERIQTAIAIKNRIVAADPVEKGLRKTLNFGHTIGHAIEAAALEKGQPIRHGYAVIQGMVAELYLSHILLDMPTNALRHITHYMLEHYGKIAFQCQDYDHLIDFMLQDKKNEQPGTISFTLLRTIGQAEINQVPNREQIKEALEYLFTL